MKKILLASLLALASFAASAQTFTVDGQCDVHYSPNGGVTQAIDTMINNAHENVYVLAYSFTSVDIANALIAAKKRGVDVEIVLDKTQPHARGGQMVNVMKAGIPVWVDKKHPIAHNKVMIVDGHIFENGSFNYTANAESKNGENALICPSVSGAKLYKANWDLHKSHSIPFTLNAKGQPVPAN